MDQIPNSQETQTTQPEAAPGSAPDYSILSTPAKSPKKKLSKKTLLILAGAVLVLAVVAAIIFIPSKFDRVKNECVHIAGQISSGKGYFTIDTIPDTYDNMDSSLRALMLPRAEENALKAIQYANSELGFPGSVYSQMLKTSALMGRQSEENSKYKVSWTYHPDYGLEVTYTKK